MLSHSLLIAMCALAVAGCALGADEETETERMSGIDREGRRDLVGLGVDTTGQRGSYAYGLYDAHRDISGSGLAFAGYGCTTDCKDIKAGYRAAAADRTASVKACTGTTWGELEGCVAFTQGLSPALTKLPRLEP